MASKRKTPRRSVRKTPPNKQRGRARRALPAKRKRAGKAAGRRTLYPAIQPYNSGMLRVSGVHEIYYEECGNPNGKPAVFVHGGPGGGCDNRSRAASSIRTPIASCCSTSAAAARAGRTPAWSTTPPGTWSPTWSGCASTWASSAGWCSAARGARRSALAYAQTHPERVTELVLRGIFMLRSASSTGSTRSGASALFPDHWEHYLAPIPPAGARRPDRGLLPAPDQRRSRRRGLPRRARGRCGKPRPATCTSTTRHLHKWGEERIRARVRAHRVPLLRQRRLLRSRRTSCCATSTRSASIPAVIVQGRYDVVCPMQTAWTLHRAWPEAELRVVADAGHSAFEPGNTHELISATDRFR